MKLLPATLNLEIGVQGSRFCGQDNKSNQRKFSNPAFGCEKHRYITKEKISKCLM
jgi:hypothetical protein